LISPAAQAKTINDQQEKIDKLAEDLEFIMEEAAIYDSQENVVDFDFDKLEAKFGKSKEFDMIKEDINNKKLSGNMQLLAKKSWKGCMLDALKDHFGVAFIEAALTGGLWAYLDKKAYKEAAKLLIKIGVGGNVIGAVAFLTYYGTRCAL